MHTADNCVDNSVATLGSRAPVSGTFRRSELSRELDRRGEASDLWLDAFEASHHAFHSALIAACPVQTLKSFCEDLYLRKERYRRVMFGCRSEINEVLAEHENLMKQILSRNILNARSALIAHIGITADVLAGLIPPPSNKT